MPPADVELLAAAIDALVEDPGLLRDLGLRARETVEARVHVGRLRPRDARRLRGGAAAVSERPVLLVTTLVPPDRVASLRALHERTPLEVAIYDGRQHHATAGVDDPGVPFVRVSQRGVHALAASGRYRAVIATSAGRIALPAAYFGARRAGVPFLYWTGIWAQVATPAHLAAIPLVRHIERSADATIAYGEHVAAYARSHGARNVRRRPARRRPRVLGRRRSTRGRRGGAVARDGR